jgi:hypothetical protein
MYYLSNIPKMPTIPGVEVPNDFYWVLSEPAPLAGMRYPETIPWGELASVGFRKVVNLAETTSSYDPSPLSIAHSIKLKDLFGGGFPPDPVGEEKSIRTAVRIVLEILNAGEGLTVHCEGGRGRSGTVIGCVLRAMGYPADEIIRDLSDLHQARGKPGWPESEWQSELLHRF